MAVNRSDAPDYYHDMAKDAVKYVKDTIGILSANKFVDDFVLRLAFGNVPALFERARLRRVLRAALLRALVRPRHQRIDLRLRQRAIVGEVAEVRVGEPWRHLAEAHGFLDRGSPRACLLIGQERHRPDLAGTMAFLAARLKDRQDFREMTAPHSIHFELNTQ